MVSEPTCFGSAVVGHCPKKRCQQPWILQDLLQITDKFTYDQVTHFSPAYILHRDNEQCTVMLKRHVLQL